MTITGPKEGLRSRTRGYSGARLRRWTDGAPAIKGSTPETPLVPWKFEGGVNSSSPEVGPEISRRGVSARELGGILWRLQLPETTPDAARGGERLSVAENDLLGLERGATLIGLPLLGRQNGKAHSCEVKELSQSPLSVTGSRNGYTCKFKPPVEISNFPMEGATKWNPVRVKTSDKVEHAYDHPKHHNQPVHDNSAISTLKCELKKAYERIHELETEKRSSKKKLEHFLKKLSEERATWRSREHEKIRAVIDDAKAELRNERKNRQRLEFVNSKLVNEVADVRLLAKRYMQDYEKEHKARELTEEVCDELAKEIGKDKAEVEALWRESMKMREEVEDERRMLQMAEVWREERVQMKLIDAKLMIEERYTYMTKLVAEVDAFLGSRSSISSREDTRKAENIQQAAASVNVKDIKEITCEPSNPDDIFSGLEDVDSVNPIEREVEQREHMFNKKTYIHHNGEADEEESGWETESQVEDQGSCCSPEGSAGSVNKKFLEINGLANVKKWEENDREGTPVTDVSEVCSAPKTLSKRGSAIARLWRSKSNKGKNFNMISADGINGRLSDSMLANGAILSTERWSSIDSGNPHITREMNGWPHGSQKSRLKPSVLEAGMDCEKTQLKQVLKQKI